MSPFTVLYTNTFHYLFDDFLYKIVNNKWCGCPIELEKRTVCWQNLKVKTVMGRRRPVAGLCVVLTGVLEDFRIALAGVVYYFRIHSVPLTVLRV